MGTIVKDGDSWKDTRKHFTQAARKEREQVGKTMPGCLLNTCPGAVYSPGGGGEGAVCIDGLNMLLGFMVHYYKICL